MKKVAAGLSALVLVSVGSCGATVLLVGGAGTSAAAAACTDPAAGASPSGTVASSVSVTPTSGAPSQLPQRIGAYHGDQITNAASIVAAGRALNLPVRGQVIGVMTAIGESTLHNVDRGDAAGPDSRGLFQQRATGWGSYADRMNPRIAATNFFRALLAVPKWEQMPPTLAAHAVQRNADPYHYEPFWNDAVAIVSVLDGIPDLARSLPAGGGLPCAPGSAGGFTGSGGPFTPEACSVVPDPSTGAGCLTPRTATLYRELVAQGWKPGCFRPSDPVAGSDHPLGRACDAPPSGSYGHLPTAAQKARGDQLAADLIAAAPKIGVHYLIWYGRIWNIERAGEGWRPYGGAGVYDPSNVTGGHFDHVHISMY